MPTGSSSPQQVFYVLSTHWDREWYQSFQDYRQRLVQLVDLILDEGFKGGQLKGPFQTDGQAIIIEDYLEVRPERAQEIQQAAAAGQLAIGPWYVLPDEFIVSGESIIRNLALGRSIARALGGVPSSAGFACDLFGHISQLPQIFAGFSIRAGLVWRGTNHHSTRYLRWVGADGTAMPCYRFGGYGYGDFTIKIRRASDFTRDFDPAIDGPAFTEFLAAEATACGELPILIFDGSDHIHWDPVAYKLISERIENGEPGRIWKHGSLDDFLAVVQANASAIETTIHGELREPGRHQTQEDQQWLIPGVLSSRVWIKQQNAACQTLLCQWAEPLSMLSHAYCGATGFDGYLNVAWKCLLQNHPHDSICGCSIDEVHEDMKYRFRQSRQIAERVALQASSRLAASIPGEVSDTELRCVVFNPLPRALAEPVELTLQIPTDWPHFAEFFGFEGKPAFTVHDAAGRELPYQRLEQTPNQWKKRVEPNRHPNAIPTHDVRVCLQLDVPALGHTCLTVRTPGPGVPTRYAEEPRLVQSECSMANDLLSVTFESNGTLTITDRRTGAVYPRCLTFEDIADIGDGWYHGMALNDERCLSTCGQAELSIVHDGPQMATFRVRVRMQVPARFDAARTRRDSVRNELLIDSLVTLRRGLDRLEVQTTVHNTCRDHRLRVLFPTGAATGTYLADGAFDVIERPIALRSDNHEYRELEVETKPQQSWTAVFAAGRGLAVLGDGLLETAVRNETDRPLALTLFRSTGRTVMTTGEPEGQLLGELAFRYWLTPLAQEPDRRVLCELGQQLAAGVRAVQLRARDVKIHRTAHEVPATASYCTLEGPAVLSSLRSTPAGVEVRLFNPCTQAIDAALDFSAQPVASARPTQAQPVDLESNPLGASLPVVAHRLALQLAPKQIATLRLS